ncbi:MAG: hypothetical protein CVU56_24770 [Deltaproteobacteria bacterium HGW-Deltaproteobacteria-14]|nr:MAG: hypothetical protein CVU56_24770 [Deltaproteobacteria bacterium HGW-Deltaproteobacteria-14]
MRALLVSLLIAAIAVPTVASAEPPGGETRLEGSLEGSKNPFRGSAFTYRNSVSAISFDKAAELTYNPTWAMSFELAPRYWFGDVLYVGASLDFTREITNDDSSTYRGETWIGNLDLRVGASKWATIPGADIDLSGTLDFILPTSKIANAQTLLFGVVPGLRLSRHFDVLKGLDVGYGIRLTKNFHRYTTGETESPVIPGCVGTVGGCDSYLNDGVRNASWRLSNSFDVGVSFTDWLSLGASFSILTSFLYDAVEDPQVSFTPQASTDTRTALVYDIGVTVTPLSYLSVSLGATTVNPQLAPDSSNYAPFFNRYTALYLDLRLDVADLVATATR